MSSTNCPLKSGLFFSSVRGYSLYVYTYILRLHLHANDCEGDQRECEVMLSLAVLSGSGIAKSVRVAHTLLENEHTLICIARPYSVYEPQPQPPHCTLVKWKESNNVKSGACVPITVSIKRNNMGGVGRRKVSRWVDSVINGVISCSDPHVRTHTLAHTSGSTRMSTCKHSGLLMVLDGENPESRCGVWIIVLKTPNVELQASRTLFFTSACLFLQLSYSCRDLNHGIKTLQYRSIFNWASSVIWTEPPPSLSLYLKQTWFNTLLITSAKEVLLLPDLPTLLSFLSPLVVNKQEPITFWATSVSCSKVINQQYLSLFRPFT